MQIVGLPDDLSVRFTVPNLYPTEPIELQRTIKSSRTLFQINRFLPPSIRSVACFHLVPEVVVVIVVDVSSSSSSSSLPFFPLLHRDKLTPRLFFFCLPTLTTTCITPKPLALLQRRAPVISIIRNKEKKHDTPRTTSKGGENCGEIAGR